MCCHIIFGAAKPQPQNPQPLILRRHVCTGLDAHRFRCLRSHSPWTCDNVCVAIILADAGTVITDLHVWQVAANQYAAIISVISAAPKPPAAYKERLKKSIELVHVTVEVHHCAVHETMAHKQSAAPNDTPAARERFLLGHLVPVLQAGLEAE